VSVKSNRIDSRFAQLRESGRKGLIPFVTAGDPSIESTVPVMHALVEAGADVIELGVPFSDPMADGPVIQQSSERALERGVGLNRVLDMVTAFRRDDDATPVVLMGYLNPLEIHGVERFVREAAEAGVDGLLMVDSPPEESQQLHALLTDAGLHQIQLAAPTTNDQRLGELIAATAGYLYYVSFAGVTGASHLDTEAVGRRLGQIHALGSVPVAVGFGIKDADSARRLARDAEAVVIGSALVAALADAGEDGAVDAARKFLAPIRAALDEIASGGA